MCVHEPCLQLSSQTVRIDNNNLKYFLSVKLMLKNCWISQSFIP